MAEGRFLMMHEKIAKKHTIAAPIEQKNVNLTRGATIAQVIRNEALT